MPNTLNRHLPGKKAVQYTKVQSLQGKLNQKEKERKVAWAKYFAELEHNQSDNIIYYETLKQVEVNAMPEHIKVSFLEMMKKLKLNTECPICLDTINPKNIDMTRCGHKFCKSCLDSLKAIPGTTKCPTCRATIWTPS